MTSSECPHVPGQNDLGTVDGGWAIMAGSSWSLQGLPWQGRLGASDTWGSVSDTWGLVACVLSCLPHTGRQAVSLNKGR